MSFIIETERLAMREFGPEDAEDFFALCTNPQVMRYVVGEEVPADVEATRERITNYPDYKRHGFGRWACIHKATGRMIGRRSGAPASLQRIAACVLETIKVGARVAA